VGKNTYIIDNSLTKNILLIIKVNYSAFCSTTNQENFDIAAYRGFE